MSPESTHKLMGLYVEGLILGVILEYMVVCFFNLLPTNDAHMRHGVSINQLEFIWEI